MRLRSPSHSISSFPSEIENTETRDMAEVCIVAGEPSGDHHGALVAREMKKLLPDLSLFGCGGPSMREEGVECVVPMESFSSVGIIEVVEKLPGVLRNMTALKRAMKARRPSAFLPIDVPDVNLRLSTFARKHGIPVVYFISPQVWAWRKGRIRRIARDVRKMLVILPFEESFYRETGIDAEFVGHPLIDQLAGLPEDEVVEKDSSTTGDVIGLLPGSRRSELDKMIPLFLDVVEALLEKYPGLRFRLFLAGGFSVEDLPSFPDAVSVEPSVAWWRRGGIRLALAASGTATLELGLLRVPTVVVYKVHWLTYLIAKRMVQAPYASLVNLIAGKRVFPEFLQRDATKEKVVQEISRLLESEKAVQGIREELAAMRGLMGEPGCPERVARRVLETAGLLGEEEIR